MSGIPAHMFSYFPPCKQSRLVSWILPFHQIYVTSKSVRIPSDRRLLFGFQWTLCVSGLLLQLRCICTGHALLKVRHLQVSSSPWSILISNIFPQLSAEYRWWIWVWCTWVYHFHLGYRQLNRFRFSCWWLSTVFGRVSYERVNLHSGHKSNVNPNVFSLFLLTKELYVSLSTAIQTAVCNEEIRLFDSLYSLFWTDGSW